MTAKSHQCSYDGCQLNSYCEIINIDVKQKSYYTLVMHENSTRNIHGYFYENLFTLFSISLNAVASIGFDPNYEAAVLHYKVNTSLQLVISAGSWFRTGKFSFSIHGPSKATMKRISIFLNLFHRKSSKMIFFYQDSVPKNVETNYLGVLNTKSNKHGHRNCLLFDYYFQLLKIEVTTTGYYTIDSNAHFDTYMYLYEHNFNLYDIDTNLVVVHKCENPSDSFRIVVYLEHNISYILMITSSPETNNVQGDFSLIINGPNKISIEPQGNFM